MMKRLFCCGALAASIFMASCFSGLAGTDPIDVDS